MQFNIPTTTRRQLALEAFRRTNTRARLNYFLKRAISATQHTLLEFGERAARLSPARRLRDVQDIPVDRIIGSLGRARDFDLQFRPLKKHLRDRWVRVYLDLEADRWEPIRVHKLGEEYFVEDGHHRVSVARHTGLDFIPAEVWEYQPAPAALPACKSIFLKMKEPAASCCPKTEYAVRCA